MADRHVGRYRVSLTRRVFAGAAQLTLANGLARALGILSLPLLTRWLAPAAYGQAALASTLISLLSVVALMGMDMSYARSFLSQKAPNGQAVEAYSWRFAALAAVIAGLAGAAAWLVYAHTVATAKLALALWIAVGVGASLLLAMAQTRTRLHGRHGRLAVAVALGGLTATAVTLALAWGVFHNELALVAGYVTAYLVTLAVLGAPEWRTFSSPSGLSAAERRVVLMVGLPGVVTAPMYWVVASADRWFLGRYASASELGIYAVACSLGTAGMMINSALMAIWLPEATRMHESGTEQTGQALGRLIARLVLVMALVWLVIAAVGGEVLRLLTDPRFHPAAAYLPWIAGGVFFYGCYHLANTGLFLSRSMAWSALLWAAVGALSLLANAVWIPVHGATSAALVQCLSFALLASTVLWVAQRKHVLPLPLARLVGILLMLLGAGWCANAGWNDSATLSLLLKLPVLTGLSLVSVRLLEPDAWARLRTYLANQAKSGAARGEGG